MISETVILEDGTVMRDGVNVLRDGRFTPVQRQMLKVLADGLPHTRDELRDCLACPTAQPKAIRVHITMLRKKLRPIGEDIICELRQGIFYRHVRLLASPNDGRR